MCFFRRQKKPEPNPIAPLTQAHYSDVCRVFEDSFDIKRFPLEEFKTIWDMRAEESCGYFIDNKLIGIAVIINRKTIKYLYFFGIDHSLRGKGIGSKMLQHILDKVSNLYLWPINERLQSWYETHGFYPSSSGYYVFSKLQLQRKARRIGK